jgi:hypothetical protein
VCQGKFAEGQHPQVLSDDGFKGGWTQLHKSEGSKYTSGYLHDRNIN